MSCLYHLWTLQQREPGSKFSGNLPQVSSTERNRSFLGEENEVDTFNLKRNGLVKIGAPNCLPDITLRVSFPGYVDSPYSTAPSSSVVPIVRGHFRKGW